MKAESAEPKGYGKAQPGRGEPLRGQPAPHRGWHGTGQPGRKLGQPGATRFTYTSVTILKGGTTRGYTFYLHLCYYIAVLVKGAQQAVES